MFICETCKKEFKTQQALNSHVGWHKPRNMAKERNPNFGKTGSNQFTKAKKEGRFVLISDETRKKLAKGGKNQIWTEKRRKNHSNIMKEAVKKYPLSYSANNVSGRTKTIEYKGKKLKGKWEVLVAQWLDNNNINWTNEITGFEYEWNGSVHLYFPDFYLIDFDKYLEVKGFERERDKEKWKVVKNLLIIKKKDINLIKSNKFGPLTQQVRVPDS